MQHQAAKHSNKHVDDLNALTKDTMSSWLRFTETLLISEHLVKPSNVKHITPTALFLNKGRNDYFWAADIFVFFDADSRYTFDETLIIQDNGFCNLLKWQLMAHRRQPVTCKWGENVLIVGTKQARCYLRKCKGGSKNSVEYKARAEPSSDHTSFHLAFWARRRIHFSFGLC